LAIIGAAVAAGPLAGHTAFAQTVSGAGVYQQRCAQCHENAAANRAPSRDALQKMPASRILRTLDFGLMMGVDYPLTREERPAVANYLGTKGPELAPPPAAFTAVLNGIALGRIGREWNGWSPSAANTRFQPAGGITGNKSRN
jgi:mono/diheme cytochrome c family protein